MTRLRGAAILAGTMALVAAAGTAQASTSPRDPGIISTSYGAHYDPHKCSVSSAYWRGARRFYLNTSANYGCMTSPWFRGAHPVMLSWGHTSAPWYPGSNFHHGVDFDMRVGTPVYSAVRGTVKVAPASMGSAYGSHGMLVRAAGKDYVLGHMSRLVVRNNQTVRAGQLLGYSGMSGVETEDGPHLHFEVRPAGSGYTDAVNPWWYTHVHRV